jgi:hypothetical protein
VSSLTGLNGLPLEDNLLSGLGGLDLLGGVGLDSVQEFLSALGVLDVFDSDIDSLLHVSTVNDLVTDYSNTSGRDVVDDTGLSVVDWILVHSQHYIVKKDIHLWGIPFCSEALALMSTISPTR